MLRVYAYDQDQNNMIIAGYDKKKISLKAVQGILLNH